MKSLRSFYLRFKFSLLVKSWEVEACSMTVAMNHNNNFFRMIIVIYDLNTLKVFDPLFGIHAMGSCMVVSGTHMEGRIDACLSKEAHVSNG